MTIEHKMGIPTVYREIVAGECFWYQEDLYLRSESGSAFSLTSGKLYEINNGATPVFRVDAKLLSSEKMSRPLLDGSLLANQAEFLD